MIISVRMRDEDGNRIKSYTKQEGITVSKFMRRMVNARLDSECRRAEKEAEVVNEETVYSFQEDI